MAKVKQYAQAGVDIELAEQTLSSVKKDLKCATRPEVIGGIGAFGGLFALPVDRYRAPVLVSSIDGVGTKLKLAFLSGQHEDIGQDIVNHCVNDIAVMGAEPLFFLDYLGMGQFEPEVFTAIIKGMTSACRAANLALIGGETAEMPGCYARGEYDVVGSVVGVVERTKILSGQAIQPGDRVIGFPSNGLHTNGYSLVRSILFDQLGLSLDEPLLGTDESIGATLLRPHLSYLSTIHSLLKDFNRNDDAAERERNVVFGFAHITGGGLIGNLPRILPQGCSVHIDKNAWEIPPLFEFLVEAGEIDTNERYEVFNMGIGLSAVIDKEQADKVLEYCQQAKIIAYNIGEVVRGEVVGAKR